MEKQNTKIVYSAKSRLDKQKSKFKLSIRVIEVILVINIENRTIQ